MIKIADHYCDTDDMTFITETVYDNNDAPVSEEVVGFYYGKPNYKSTGKYYKQYKAVFCKED